MSPSRYKVTYVPSNSMKSSVSLEPMIMESAWMFPPQHPFIYFHTCLPWRKGTSSLQVYIRGKMNESRPWWIAYSRYKQVEFG
jgi:hypothetical protein